METTSYLKHRNTIFCNTVRAEEFERSETKGRTLVEHSYLVPLDTIYYVDNEGVLSVYKIEADNE